MIFEGYDFKRTIIVTHSLSNANCFWVSHRYSKTRTRTGTSSAMCFLHNEKIVHRDLKPQNLLLDSKNNIKIADFGLSRMFCSHQSSPSSNNIKNNRACGTPNYMAPELFSAYVKKKRSLLLESKEDISSSNVEERIDFLMSVRADVYAYGITLAAMLLPGT